MKLFPVTALFVLPLVGVRAQDIRPLSPHETHPPSAQERLRPDAIQLQGDEWVIPELILGGCKVLPKECQGFISHNSS